MWGKRGANKRRKAHQLPKVGGAALHDDADKELGPGEDGRGAAVAPLRVQPVVGVAHDVGVAEAAQLLGLLLRVAGLVHGRDADLLQHKLRPVVHAPHHQHVPEAALAATVEQGVG